MLSNSVAQHFQQYVALEQIFISFLNLCCCFLGFNSEHDSVFQFDVFTRLRIEVFSYLNCLKAVLSFITYVFLCICGDFDLLNFDLW